MEQPRKKATEAFEKVIHVICGPPCAGKSTYIRERASPGEIVIDFDRIAEAIGASTSHQAHGKVWEAAQAARSALIDFTLESADTAWIIDSLPSDNSRKRYETAGAEFTVLDPGIDVCMERAEERPDGTANAIKIGRASCRERV